MYTLYVYFSDQFWTAFHFLAAHQHRSLPQRFGNPLFLQRAADLCDHYLRLPDYQQDLQPSDSLVHGMFQAVSITTTTGFATKDFAQWPSFLPVMLLMFSFMGGCVGSTGGGMKAMRLMLIYKQGVRELKQLVHPQAIIPLKVGRRRVEAAVVSAVWSFFAVYTTCFIIIMLLLMATGLDFTTAFSAVAASINNLGLVWERFHQIMPASAIPPRAFSVSPCCWDGLEVFTLLVLFTPMFWRI